ncbi:MAG TPA: SDR family oxidoreductase [Desulfomonilia bacterium]|nr:SDR family oxidoreductase [Desulfomonilia bacterium]
MFFPGKVVWITGASSGIGEALAFRLSSLGADLVLSARNVNKLIEVRDRCSNSQRHLVLPLDLEDPSTFSDAVVRVLDRFGRIDLLINSGGISQRSLASQTSLETDRRIMETNFFGTVALTKSVLPSMFERGSGLIVVISSLVGKFGTPLRSAYSASKHALHGFFDSLRAEVHTKGIKVSIICPGFVRTNISLNALCGDGSCHGVMDEAQAEGMLPEACAEKIIKAIEKGKDEALIGGKELVGVYLKRFAPCVFNRLIARAKVT